MENKKEKIIYHFIAFNFTLFLVLDIIGNIQSASSLVVIFFHIIFEMYILVYILESVAEKLCLNEQMNKDTKVFLKGNENNFQVVKICKKYNIYGLIHMILLGGGLLSRFIMKDTFLAIILSLIVALILTHWILLKTFIARDKKLNKLIKNSK